MQKSKFKHLTYQPYDGDFWCLILCFLDLILRNEVGLLESPLYWLLASSFTVYNCNFSSVFALFWRYVRDTSSYNFFKTLISFDSRPAISLAIFFSKISVKCFYYNWVNGILIPLLLFINLIIAYYLYISNKSL